MNPYQIPWVCDVCGESGMLHVRDAAAPWMGATVRHSNPNICASNLRAKRELEAAKKNVEDPCPSI